MKKTERTRTDSRPFHKRHSLGIFVVGVFLLKVFGTLTLGWNLYQSEQEDHGVEVTLSGFWLWWGFEITMSLVADVFGFALMLFAKGQFHEVSSPEGKD